MAKKAKGRDKDADDLLPVLEFEDQIDEDDRPGKEDQGLIHVGQGNIAVSRLVGFHPAKEHESDGVKDESGTGAVETKPSSVLGCSEDEVPRKQRR